MDKLAANKLVFWGCFFFLSKLYSRLPADLLAKLYKGFASKLLPSVNDKHVASMVCPKAISGRKGLNTEDSNPLLFTFVLTPRRIHDEQMYKVTCSPCVTEDRTSEYVKKQQSGATSTIPDVESLT